MTPSYEELDPRKVAAQERGWRFVHHDAVQHGPPDPTIQTESLCDAMHDRLGKLQGHGPNPNAALDDVLNRIDALEA